MSEIFGDVAASVLSSVASTAVSVAVSYAVQSLTAGGASSNTTDRSPSYRGTAEVARGRSVMIRGSIEPCRVIYGEILTSGTIVFWGTTGENNDYLVLALALAGHEVEAIGDVYLDDKLSTDAKYSGLVYITKNLGSDSQAADTTLLTLFPTIWSASHQLKGIAYLVAQIKWSPETWTNGIPNIRAVVKGRKVYDPRTGATAWSANSALCQRDYIRASFGIRADAAEVNEASWGAAASLCDEAIPLALGGTVPRYTCNGSFQMDERPVDVMAGLLSSSMGTVIYSQGQYVGYAAAYTSPLASLDEDDLRGDVSLVNKPSRKDLFNSVRGTYVDASNQWQGADFKPWVGSAYVTEDNDIELVRDIELPYTTHFAIARRIAKLALERQRRSRIINFPAKLSALHISCWDTVTLSIADLGITSEVYRVVSWMLTEEGGIDLTLQEESSASYAWNMEEDPLNVAPALPFTYVYPPPFFTVTAGEYGAGDPYAYQGSSVMAVWPVFTSAKILHGGRIEIVARPGAGTTGYPGPWMYFASAAGADTSVALTVTEPGIIAYPYTYFDFALRLVNADGDACDWVYVLDLPIAGYQTKAVIHRYDQLQARSTETATDRGLGVVDQLQARITETATTAVI